MNDELQNDYTAGHPSAPTSEPKSRPVTRLNTLGIVLFSTFICFMFTYGFPLTRNLVQRANREKVLHSAAAGDLVRVKVLLDAGADANAKDSDGFRALIGGVAKWPPGRGAGVA